MLWYAEVLVQDGADSPSHLLTQHLQHYKMVNNALCEDVLQWAKLVKELDNTLHQR